MKIDKEKLIEACRCGHDGCVGDICPVYDEDCPAYICKNELLYAVYVTMKKCPLTKGVIVWQTYFGNVVEQDQRSK